MNPKEKGPSQNIQQTETDKIKKDVRISLTKLFFSSLRNDDSLDGIDKDPILAIKEILLFSENIKTLPNTDLLGLNLEGGSVKEMAEKRKAAENFIIYSVTETVRIIESKINHKEELTPDEELILMDLEAVKTPNGERYATNSIKRTWKDHFYKKDETGDLPEDSDEKPKNKKKKTPEIGPDTLRDMYISVKIRHNSIWTLVQRYKQHGLKFEEIKKIVDEYDPKKLVDTSKTTKQ